MDTFSAITVKINYFTKKYKKEHCCYGIWKTQIIFYSYWSIEFLTNYFKTR